MFTKAANKNRRGEVWRICLLESMIKEVWCLCHQSNLGGHRCLEGTLSKLLKGFFLLSARQKIHFLNGGCDTCLTKEWRMPVRTSLTGYVGEKLYKDLVSMSQTIRENIYMLTAEDSFSLYCQVFPIPNKEAHKMAKVLMDNHFNVYGLPDQLHADNGRDFVNNLWRELFSEYKIQHITTPPYNPSSNPVEFFNRTLTAMLRNRGPGVQENWDLWLNVLVFAQNTKVSSSTGGTLH